MREEFPISSGVMKMNWSNLGKGFRGFGWEFEERPKIKKFKRGFQQISVVKVSKDKWKVEYFIDGRLEDSMGVMDEEYAKVLAAELCVLRGFYPKV